MSKRIAVETLTLAEVSKMFQESLEIAKPKFNNWLQFEKKKLRKLKITRRKWVKSYEEFIGAKINFYCELEQTNRMIDNIGFRYNFQNTHATANMYVVNGWWNLIDRLEIRVNGGIVVDYPIGSINIAQLSKVNNYETFVLKICIEIIIKNGTIKLTEFKEIIC